MQYTVIFVHYVFYGAAWVALFSIGSEAWLGHKSAVGSFCATLGVAVVVCIVHAVLEYGFNTTALEYSFDVEVKLAESVGWLLGAYWIMRVRQWKLAPAAYLITPKQSKKK